MMKKFFKTFIGALSCAVMMTCSALGASAVSDNSAAGFDGDLSNCGVYDEKGLFDSDELAELDELVRETADELDMYIAIYLSDDARSEYSTESFADENYEALFGEDTDGVFYYMDLSEQYSAYDYISTSGKAIVLYQDSIDDMLDEIFDYLPASGETIYASEIERGIEEILNVLENYGDSEPGFWDYYHDTSTDKYIYYKNGELVVTSSKPAAAILKNLVFAIPGGIILGVIFYFMTKSHYKFKKGHNSAAYVCHEQTNFTQREDRFIRTRVSKTRIQSSSCGGRSGGGGGGGGSHGGGGGHR
ncbi:MAG: TPM domain-containing protein [Ruminococcus sp.]|nr:TPM domain-containing protein [Ruminococcus sp.]